MMALFLPVVPSLATIAYQSRPGSTNRILSIVSLVAYASVMPWTLLGIFPTNNVMLKIVADKDEKLAEGALKLYFPVLAMLTFSCELAEKGPALLQKWKGLNDIRISLFLTSWSTLVAGILLRLQ